MSDAPTGALAGVKVIDLTRVLGGPYCTQLLGDHGAEIVKIEPPQGDEVRDWGRRSMTRTPAISSASTAISARSPLTCRGTPASRCCCVCWKAPMS